MKKILFIFLTLMSSLAFSQEVKWSGPISESLKFTVPEGVKGFLISVEYKDLDSDIMIKDLISPSDEKYIGNNIGTPAAVRIPSKVDTVFKSKVRMTYVTKGKFAALVSGSDDSGLWSLRLANGNKKVASSSVYINIKYLLKSDDKDLSLDIDVNADILNSGISKAQLSTTLDNVTTFFSRYDMQLTLMWMIHGVIFIKILQI